MVTQISYSKTTGKQDNCYHNTKNNLKLVQHLNIKINKFNNTKSWIE